LLNFWITHPEGKEGTLEYRMKKEAADLSRIGLNLIRNGNWARNLIFGTSKSEE